MTVSAGKHNKKKTCWNCGEEGHFKHQCKKPLKDSEK
jgi:Zinc knuckle